MKFKLVVNNNKNGFKKVVLFSRFVVFSLLIPYVHREGTIGQQARDALLHCMKISKQNLQIAEFIALHSNICPVSVQGHFIVWSVFYSGILKLLREVLQSRRCNVATCWYWWFSGGVPWVMVPGGIHILSEAKIEKPKKVL